MPFIFVGATFLFTLVMLETLAPVLLKKKKAAKLRKETEDPMYRTIEELEKKPFEEVVVIALLRPFIMDHHLYGGLYVPCDFVVSVEVS